MKLISLPLPAPPLIRPVARVAPTLRPPAALASLYRLARAEVEFQARWERHIALTLAGCAIAVWVLGLAG